MSFLTWQLADSGFPAGGFAHSGGLEASVQSGYVFDGESLRLFVRQTIAQAGRGAMPLVAAAHRNVQELGELDRLSEAFLSNPVANRASRVQGRAFLSTNARSFPWAALPPLEERVRNERLAGHHAPLFGAVLNILGVDRRETERLFLFLAARSVGAAAVRLGVIGAYEAQALQTLVADDIDRTIDRCADLQPSDISQTTPITDLCQSTHDRLYSRLFQS